jgi:hypothetical protein
MWFVPQGSCARNFVSSVVMFKGGVTFKR